MPTKRSRLHRLLALLWRPLRAAAYRWTLFRGRAAGDLRYATRNDAPPSPFLLELRLRADGPAAISRDQAAAWCRAQTLAELAARGCDGSGREVWRLGPVTADVPAPWFAAPGTLPDVLPVHLEAGLLIAAAEDVDAVVLRERVPPPLDGAVSADAAASDRRLRPFALYRSSSWSWDATTDTVRAVGNRSLVKLIDTAGVASQPHEPTLWNRLRRGPYLSTAPLPARLEIGIRDVASRGRPRRDDAKPALLVLTSFLARGGAEHTLFETLLLLKDRFEIAVVTLAPHRAELGDRRDDFRAVTERIFCLGDLVHPAAMPGILATLLATLDPVALYNANGTTLFYDLVPPLKAAHPSLRVVDHLYDHRVGYIDRYPGRLLATVDTVVAENHRIATALVDERAWPPERVSVIWPCGRPAAAFPPPEERGAVRRRVRRELGLADSDVVFLTAARMHPQKRPLDLVALAARVRDLAHVRFLLVGGGELEAEVDAAIAASGARVARLPFRSDIPDLIVAVDVGCLVSEFEGLPVFMVECLQAGVPFLGTAVGEMGEVLRSARAGLVVERPGDLPALERCVRRLAAAGERSALAEGADLAGTRFSVAACAERYAEVFLGRKPAGERHP